MMDPLLLSTWETVGKGMCEAWCRSNPQATNGFHIVAAFLHDEHWFPVWISPRSNTLVAHRISDALIEDALLFPILNALRDCLGFQEVVLHVMPDPLPPHDMCGAAAVAFIGHLLVAPLPNDLQELSYMHSNMKASFVDALFKDACCIGPVAWGSGPFNGFVKPLADELIKHGVAEAKADDAHSKP